MGEDEIGHVVEGKGALEAFRGDFPRGENIAGIVDEHVDPRLGCSNLRPDPFHLGHQGKIAVMGAVCGVRSEFAQPREHVLAALAIARDQHDAGADARQPLGRDLPNARGCPGDDDDLAVNGSLPGSSLHAFYTGFGSRKPSSQGHGRACPACPGHDGESDAESEPLLVLARLRGFAVRKQYFWRRAPDTSLIFRADILPHSRKTAVVKTYPIPMP
jgi:hypothetical protein